MAFGLLFGQSGVPPGTGLVDAAMICPSHSLATGGVKIEADIGRHNVAQLLDHGDKAGLFFGCVDDPVKLIVEHEDVFVIAGAVGFFIERIKLMKLLWDAIGSEFGGRHEPYERNYSGSNEVIRFENLFAAQASGQADQMIAFVDKCMAEYNEKGWIVPDLFNPDDVNLFASGKYG